MIDRRTFFVGVACSLLAPALAGAQQAGKVWRIGIIYFLPRTHRFVQQFLSELRGLGYVEGQNLVIDYMQGFENQVPDFVRELELQRADLIFVPNTPSALAARAATRSMPIVFALAGDPVGSRLVESLAHPGGNATGMSAFMPAHSAKRLQFAKELMPRLTRLAVLWDPANPVNVAEMRETERGAKTLGLQLQPLEFRAPDELAGAMESAKQGRAEAIHILRYPLAFSMMDRIVSLAAKNRLPSIFPWREAVEAGGLISYGANFADNFRRAAGYVDKILKGAKPGDLPVEQPTQFDLVINLKTARALGIAIPQSILLRADEVIQ